jgi:hypothetical protein
MWVPLARLQMIVMIDTVYSVLRLAPAGEIEGARLLVQSFGRQKSVCSQRDFGPILHL